MKALRLVFYFLLLIFVLLVFTMHQTGMLSADKFTYYIVGIVVVVLALPLVEKIKVFDVVEVTKPRIFRKK